MKILIRSIFILSFIVLVTVSVSDAASDAEIVTYADFGRIRDIAVSISHVYFATTEGIIRYNQLERFWEEPLTEAAGIDYRDFFRVYVDQFDEKLYARSEFSSYEYDLRFRDWYIINEIPQLQQTYRHVNPPRIMYAPPGYNYTADGYIIEPSGRNFAINDLVDDNTGKKWMGTWGYGAAVVSPSDVIEFLPYGLLQNRVNAIYDDEGILIIGGEIMNAVRTGITFFDPDINEFEYLESGVGLDLPDYDIYCFEGDDDYIYTGTSYGLAKINRQTLKVTSRITERAGLASNTVLSLCRNGDTLFVGTAGGLNVLVPDADSLSLMYPMQFGNTEIYDMELTDSTIWIASSSGAYQMYLRTGRLQKFQDPHMMIFNRAYNIEREGENLYIASDGGMVRLNLRTGDSVPYISNSKGYRYRALAVNRKLAFMSSNNGFTMFYLSDGGYNNEREFTVADGLPSDRIFSLLLDGDFLWVGTDRGLSRFWWNDPNRID